MTRNIAGKMKSTVGKSILIGAFIARSSAAACLRRRASAAWTRRIRPRVVPSWSAWMIARVNARQLWCVDAVGHALERFGAALADPHLAQREAELLGQRAVHVLVQLGQRRVEAETGLDADREQVERVRQVSAGPFLSAASLERQGVVRAEEAQTRRPSERR